MKLIHVVGRPHNCQDRILDFLVVREVEAQESPGRARDYVEPWIGSIVECDCGKLYRLEDFQIGGPQWIVYHGSVSPVAASGRTRL